MGSSITKIYSSHSDFLEKKESPPQTFMTLSKKENTSDLVNFLSTYAKENENYDTYFQNMLGDCLLEETHYVVKNVKERGKLFQIILGHSDISKLITIEDKNKILDLFLDEERAKIYFQTHFIPEEIDIIAHLVETCSNHDINDKRLDQANTLYNVLKKEFDKRIKEKDTIKKEAKENKKNYINNIIPSWVPILNGLAHNMLGSWSEEDFTEKPFISYDAQERIEKALRRIAERTPIIEL